ncbi:MAG: hypothetical protein R2697_09215 [Ilumatobacteraceae bacterium]
MPSRKDGVTRPVRRAMISAQIEIAVSSRCVRAPRSRPTGDISRSSSTRIVSARLGQPLGRFSCVVRLPITPMYPTDVASATTAGTSNFRIVGEDAHRRADRARHHARRTSGRAT